MGVRHLGREFNLLLYCKDKAILSSTEIRFWLHLLFAHSLLAVIWLFKWAQDVTSTIREAGTQRPSLECLPHLCFYWLSVKWGGAPRSDSTSAPSWFHIWGETCLQQGQRSRWPHPQHSHTPTGPGYGCHSGVKGQTWSQGKGWSGGQTGRGQRGSRGEGGREEGTRETGIWEVTVNRHARRCHHTINIKRRKYRRGARERAKTKAPRNGEGGGHVLVTRWWHRIPASFKLRLILKTEIWPCPLVNK